MSNFIDDDTLRSIAGIGARPRSTDYGDPVSAITAAAQETGIDPSYLMGLARLETQLGNKTIRKGDEDTFNLFNIKDPTGKGTRAYDKAEGSNDAYRKYDSYDESANDVVSLLLRRYPGAAEAKTPEEFAQALKKGGYATDPDYVAKLTNTIKSVQGSKGAAPATKSFSVLPDGPRIGDLANGRSESLTDRVSSGVSSMMRALKLTGMGVGQSSAEDIASVIAEGASNAIPQSDAAKEMEANREPYVQAYKDAKGSDAVLAFGKLAAQMGWDTIKNPGETMRMLAENLPNSLPGIISGAAGAAGGGAVAGPVGAAVGGVSAGFAGGVPVEYGAEFEQRVLAKAKELGVDPTNAAALAPIVKEYRQEFQEKALAKGITTAGVDAVLTRLTFGLGTMVERGIAKEGRAISEQLAAKAITPEVAATRLAALEAKQAAANQFSSKVLRHTATGAGEMFGEGASEGLGRIATGDPFDPVDAIQEGLLGMGQGVVMSLGGNITNKALGITPVDAVDVSVQRAKEAVATVMKAQSVDEAIAAQANAVDSANSTLTEAVSSWLGDKPAAPKVSETNDKAPEVDRLAQVQKAIDENIKALAEVNKQANPDVRARMAAELQQQTLSGPLGANSMTRAPVDVNAMPTATPMDQLQAKEAGVQAARAAVEAANPAQPLTEMPPLVQRPIVDSMPMDAREVRNRLTVMRDQLKQQGGDPASLVAVAHPTEKGKFAIANQDPKVRLDPTKTGNTALAGDAGVGVREKPTIVNPVNAYVAARRGEATPQARAFVQAYDAGQITDADVQKIIDRDQKAANEPTPLTYNKDGTPGVVAVETNKPRGESADRAAVISDTFKPTPPKGPVEETAPEPTTAPIPEADQMPTDAAGFNKLLPIRPNDPGIRKASEDKDFGALVEQLKNSPNPVVARMGQLAQKLVGITKLTAPRDVIGGKPGILGQYRYGPITDSITMKTSHAGDEWTNTHEVAHAVLARIMDNPTAAQKPYVDKITALYKHVKVVLRAQGQGNQYGLQDIHEFMSEAWSNQEFQRLLMNIPYKSRSVWSQFVQSVANLLGIKNNNALTEALILGEKLGEMGRAKGQRVHNSKTFANEGKASSERTDTTESPERGAPTTSESKEATPELLQANKVDPSSLPRIAGPGRISRGQYNLIAQIARIFGKNVVLFDGKAAGVTHTGAVFNGDSKTIYLNVASQNAHLAVFGHELMHQLRADNPKAYDAILAVMKLTDKGAEQFGEYYGKGADNEELLSDLLGNRFMEPSFWNGVFKEIAATHGETIGAQIIAKLGAAIMRAVNAVLKSLNGQTAFDSDAFVANLNELKVEMQKQLAAYAVDKRTELQSNTTSEQVPTNTNSEETAPPPDTAGKTGRAEDVTPGYKASEDRDSYSNLKGKKVSYSVKIEDTGETAQVTIDAAKALSEADKRNDALDRLAKCIK